MGENISLQLGLAWRNCYNRRTFWESRRNHRAVKPHHRRLCHAFPPQIQCIVSLVFVFHIIGVAGSFSEGGQPFCPAKIQSFPANIFSCQGGAKFFNSVLPSYRAKLLCQTVLPIGKSCKWMAEKQAKMKEKIAEINQKWQKTDKNDRKTGKMRSFTNYHLPSSHFCPAKLLFLSCQAAISVMPSSHFCSAKLPFLSCQAN